MERPHLPQGRADSAKAANGTPAALAESILHEARRDLTVGTNPMALTRGIDTAVESRACHAHTPAGEAKRLAR